MTSTFKQFAMLGGVLALTSACAVIYPEPEPAPTPVAKTPVVRAVPAAPAPVAPAPAAAVTTPPANANLTPAQIQQQANFQRLLGVSDDDDEDGGWGG